MPSVKTNTKMRKSGLCGGLGRHSLVALQLAESYQGSLFRSASLARRHYTRLEALVILVSCVEAFSLGKP